MDNIATQTDFPFAESVESNESPISHLTAIACIMLILVVAFVVIFHEKSFKG